MPFLRPSIHADSRTDGRGPSVKFVIGKSLLVLPAECQAAAGAAAEGREAAIFRVQENSSKMVKSLHF